MDDRVAQALDHLDRLVAFPTMSRDANLEMIGYLADALAASGARLHMFHDGSAEQANVFASCGPLGDRRGLLLAGHTDVADVAGERWRTDPFRLVEHAGRLYGRGTCDMKGFIACALAMAPVLAAQARARPVYFAFTYDAGISRLGAPSLAEDLKARACLPEVALIGEPTGMMICEAHKGVREYRARFRSRPRHSGDPRAGASAADFAVRYAAHLRCVGMRLRAEAPETAHHEPPWSTVNIGRIAAGRATNELAGEAVVEWEIRHVRDADAAAVEAEMARFVDEELLPEMRRAAPEARIEVTRLSDVPRLEPLDRNPARDLVAGALGDRSNRATPVSYATEAGRFQRMGVPAVLCGPGHFEDAQGADEFVARRDVERCLDLLSGLAPFLAGEAAAPP
jgi:acetylornithine deacetylase